MSPRVCWLSSTTRRPVVWVSHEAQCPPCWHSVAVGVQTEVGHKSIIEKAPSRIVYFWPTLSRASADRWPHFWLQNALINEGVHGILHNCGCLTHPNHHPSTIILKSWYLDFCGSFSDCAIQNFKHEYIEAWRCICYTLIWFELQMRSRSCLPQVIALVDSSWHCANTQSPAVAFTFLCASNCC